MSQINSGGNAVKIQGVPVDPTPPTDGQVLEYHNDSGKWEPTTPGGGGGSTKLVIDGLTFAGGAFVGAIYYITGFNTIDLAQANVLATSGAIGVYEGVASQITVGGKVTMYFGPGMTLTAGDRVFLSPITAGNATNIEPTTPGQISFILGRILDIGTYIIGEGGTVFCTWQPQTPIIV